MRDRPGHNYSEWVPEKAKVPIAMGLASVLWMSLALLFGVFWQWVFIVAGGAILSGITCLKAKVTKKSMYALFHALLMAVLWAERQVVAAFFQALVTYWLNMLNWFH